MNSMEMRTTEVAVDNEGTGDATQIAGNPTTDNLTTDNLTTASAPLIRSYVLRQGRETKAQHYWRELMLPQYGVPFQSTPVDWQAIFGAQRRHAAKIVEIGCGMGDTTIEIAAAHPECDYIGIEVHSPGIGHLCQQISELNLTNLRLIQHDAVAVFLHMFTDNSLDGVHVFFPDPWPKKRHHKRRLLQPPFVQTIVARLKTGGYLHCATDWAEYADAIRETLNAHPALQDQSAQAGQEIQRPQTKFERRGLRLGHQICDLYYVKAGAL